MAKMNSGGLQIDIVGNWSEIKLEIIRDYAEAYSKILTAQTKPALEHVYLTLLLAQVCTYPSRQGVSLMEVH